MKKLALLFFLSFTLCIGDVIAQDENKAVTDTLEKEILVIPIGEISSRTEEISIRIVELREQIKPSSEISTIDTVLDASFIKLNEERELIYSDSSDQSYRSLVFILKEWEAYEKQFKAIQDNLKSRSDQIKDISDEINDYLAVWQETRDDGIEHKASKRSN